MESTDLTSLVVRAICKCLVPGCDVLTFCDVCDVFLETHKVFLKTNAITQAAVEIADQLDSGIDPEHITNRRIGWIIKKLRLEKGREPGTGRHGCLVSQTEMARFVIAYGLHTPGKTSQNVTTSQDETRDGDEREVFEL